MHKLAALVLLLILTGCSSAPLTNAVLKADAVKTGQTTVSDLEALLGDDYKTEDGPNSEYIVYKIDKSELEEGVLSARLVFEIKDDIVIRYFVDKSMECNEAKGIYCIQSRSANAQTITLPRR